MDESPSADESADKNVNKAVPPGVDDDITWEKLSYWLEFGCWTALVLFPFLRWINGPSVSTDQFVVRTGLVVLSVLGAVGLRTYKIVRARRQHKLPNSNSHE
jgi:hypothetical protein